VSVINQYTIGQYVKPRDLNLTLYQSRVI